MTRWAYDCPYGCGYYIDVSMGSGGPGERASRLLDEHIEDAHAAAVSP